jgi:hypothetical protein
MDSTRRTSFVTGVLFLITFVTSIPAALLLYAPVLDDANYVIGAGADTGVAWARSWRSCSSSPTSAPPSRCSPSSSGRTKGSRSAMSPPGSLNAPSSPSASSASLRS